MIFKRTCIDTPHISRGDAGPQTSSSQGFRTHTRTLQVSDSWADKQNHSPHDLPELSLHDARAALAHARDRHEPRVAEAPVVAHEHRRDVLERDLQHRLALQREREPVE